MCMSGPGHNIDFALSHSADTFSGQSSLTSIQSIASILEQLQPTPSPPMATFLKSDWTEGPIPGTCQGNDMTAGRELGLLLRDPQKYRLWTLGM